MGKRRLFCEMNPFFYWLSVKKEIAKRHIKNLFSRVRLARTKEGSRLFNTVKTHSSVLVRRLHNVDITLQENKVTNIILTCERINGIVIRPGETFSFWKTVGKTTAKKGYKEGLVIKKSGVSSGVGGGLCQMANMIHWLVLNSPLTVTELHHHSDALFPDERRKVPFGTGTSINYNNLDYRFRNDTDQSVQILVWCEDGELKGELKSETEFPFYYELQEENHHFKKEGDDFYRISQVYRIVRDRKDDSVIRKELILDNHSLVMYDHSLIPTKQIRQEA